MAWFALFERHIKESWFGRGIFLKCAYTSWHDLLIWQQTWIIEFLLIKLNFTPRALNQFGYVKIKRLPTRCCVCFTLNNVEHKSYIFQDQYIYWYKYSSGIIFSSFFPFGRHVFNYYRIKQRKLKMLIVEASVQSSPRPLEENVSPTKHFFPYLKWTFFE